MQNWLNRRQRPWAVACAVIGAALLLLGAAFRRGGLNDAASVAVLIAIVPYGVAVLMWAARASKPAGDSTQTQLDQAALDLAGFVREQWLTEAAARRLYDPNPVAVRWQLSKRPVGDLAANVAAHWKPGFTGRSDQIAALANAFWSLDRRRLVILGKPGMGKTTLAVLLLLELLKGSPTSLPGPVPVLFSLTSFDPGHDSLDSWLARRLGEDYPGLRAATYGRDAPTSLVRRRMILPVLDGLDELSELVRGDTIAKLNRALADGELGLILTCRTDEYPATAGAGDVLRSAAVIEPDPLYPTQAIDYLESCIPANWRKAWQPVLDSLRHRPKAPLARALDTPLMLWLIRQVYLDTGSDPAELIDTRIFTGRTAIESHLLHALVPAMIKANPPDPRQVGRPRRAWHAPEAQRWLGYLAHHLDALGKRELAWWQIRAAIPRRRLSWVMALLFALLFSILVGLPWALPFWFAVGPSTGLTIGLVFGLGFGLFLGAAVGGFTQLIPMGPPHYADLGLRNRTPELSRGIRNRLRSGLVFAIGFGLSIGVLIGFTAGRLTLPPLAFGPVFALELGLALALSFGLTLALLEWALQPSSSSPSSTPANTLRADRSLFLLRGIVFSVGFGIAAGLGFGLPVLVVEPSLGLSFALWFGSLAFPFGLLFGFFRYRPAWPFYVVARVLLARRRALPWRLMGFLDDAHRLGILRQVGAAYQFRHATLQDHLAQWRSEEITPKRRHDTAVGDGPHAL